MLAKNANEGGDYWCGVYCDMYFFAIARILDPRFLNSPLFFFFHWCLRRWKVEYCKMIKTSFCAGEYDFVFSLFSSVRRKQFTLFAITQGLMFS